MISLDHCSKASDNLAAVSHDLGPEGAIRISVTCRYTFQAKNVKVAAGVDVTMTHEVRTDGTVFVSMLATASKTLPPLPRVGFRMRCPSDMQTVEWFGRGPHECYPDRKASATLGRYVSSIHSMHVPYIVPSENGGRADVSWLALQRIAHPEPIKNVPRRECDPESSRIIASDIHAEVGPGLLISLPEGETAQFSVQRHSLEDLEAAAHTHELEAATGAGDGSVHVHVDHLHMGVGGDDSWTPSVHPEFLIPTGSTWNCSLTLATLHGVDDPFETRKSLFLI